MSLRMKFSSVRDPEGRFLKSGVKHCSITKHSSSRGLVLSSSLHLFYRHFKYFDGADPKPVQVPHFPYHQGHRLISLATSSALLCFCLSSVLFPLLILGLLPPFTSALSAFLLFFMDMQSRGTRKKKGDLQQRFLNRF